MGDMTMNMARETGVWYSDRGEMETYKSGPMSAMIGSGTSEVVGVMMYTMGDRLVPRTGTMQDAMMDAMDAAWNGIYKVMQCMLRC